MKLFFDMSSVLWTGLLAGKDPEGTDVQHGSRKVTVNTCAYGYENVVNSMNAAIKEFNCVPMDVVMVFEGRDSKKRRTLIDTSYKANREGDKDSRPPEAYVQFNLLKDLIKDTYRNLGAVAVSQAFVEGDDVLGWLAFNSEEDCVVVTNDNDLAVLNGTNEYGATCRVRINGELGKNKYGEFDVKLVSLYKGLVGDSSDNVKGCPGFGPAAWMRLNIAYGDDGCFELEQLINEGKRDEIASIAKDNNCKLLNKIVDQWDAVRKSLRLTTLHPEWVNTVKQQLVWEPGMVRKLTDDERLKPWRAASRLVTAGKFDDALVFLKSKLDESPFFTIDFETTVDDESTDWLEARGKKGVDVIGSRIVSMGLSFGNNNQYGFYIPVEHADTDNCTLDQLAQFIEAIPQDKFIVAQNAAGFELPVAYNTYAERWKDNGWRGFIPNMVDTRIAATFWDENQPSHGLKQLTKLLFQYEQATYAQTTQKSAVMGELKGGQRIKTYDVEGVEWETREYKMHELTAKEVTAYGLDDVYTAGALWNFFKLFMQLDHTYDAFKRLEQKPMYLSALAYVQGIEVDMERLKLLEAEDKVLSDECWGKVEAFLIEKGWEGVTCPVFEELNPANIKQAVEIILGMELKTMVRTVSKLAVLVSELEHDDAASLAKFIEEDRVDLVNAWVKRVYKGTPNFNVGSPSQITKLMYEVIGAPVRLRNKATDAMKAKGIREGNPRTDDGAIEMAVKMGDVKGVEAEVLEALLTMKSCNTRNALYWSSYPTMIQWKTGRLHPEVRQSGTNTRRFTGSTPNIMQMQGDEGGVRSVIKDGKRLIGSLDQSSQEVRLMAELSQDAGLLSCYLGDNLRDTHSLVAHRIAKVTYEEFMAMRKSENKEVATKANSIRQISKTVFFGNLYGSAAPKTAETLGISVEEAQGYIDAIEKAFPGIKTYQEASSNMAETQGWVPILGGTKRHLAELVNSDDKWTASKALRQAGNARIQGAAANQIKTVMSDIWDSDLLENSSFRWVFPCHDEIVVSTDKKDTVEVIQRLHQMMVKPFMTTLPSESSIGVGRSYGFLKEMPEESFKGGRFDREMLQKTVDSLFA